MSDLIGLDFETYGDVDLPTHGLERYVRSPEFRVLLAAVDDDNVVPAVLDFVKEQPDLMVARLEQLIGNKRIVAHNAGFERRVLQTLGLNYSASRFIDSAVVARVAGAASRLEAAAPQLLSTEKMEEGRDLIRLFSIPGEHQRRSGHSRFDPQVVEDHPEEWQQFKDYCALDAGLSLTLVQMYQSWLTETELSYQTVTMRMNQTGWHVDVPLVEEMQRRYLENQEQALYEFRVACNAPDLNLNSLKQLKEWCADRGIRATSFDEKNVESLINRLEQRLNKAANRGNLDPAKIAGYTEVLQMLYAKRAVGGSSLKKLQVILDTVGDDGRLRDQYLHCGAGQSLRTTGRSVQMQNLKRLKEPADMATVFQPDAEWSNDELASNLRQVFTATHPQGALIVGDFSSVESRGLAYLAWEEWKLDSYRQSQDLYKVLASRIFDRPYELITKDQRQIGKVGELSCGYGAGPGAVQTFAANMGLTLSEGEAGKLVTDWRAANPEIVEFWYALDRMLHAVVETRSAQSCKLPDGLVLSLSLCSVPRSLEKQHPNSVSVRLEVSTKHHEVILLRYFHGCYIRGRNICYYKPSDRKTGDLWRNHFIDPKTKQLRFYELYGGKLAGILTQSFCREIFFRVLWQVDGWVQGVPNLKLVGQFHDEIVLDWQPGAADLYECRGVLRRQMSDSGELWNFPLAAEVKADYRYTK